MKVLVTGGAGFIGSHLVEKLVSKNYEVIVLDNLSTGNLKNLKKVKSKIKFFKYDLVKKKNLASTLHGVKFIYHLAGLSKTLESIKKPKKYYKGNVVATLNLLNECKKIKLKKFVYAASASCYGNPKNIPTSENSKINNLTPYAYTKWKAEQLIMKKSRQQKFSAISLRFFNVYGPRSAATSSYSSVISIFLKLKKNNKPLMIFGDGKQTRDFVHVSDVVNALIKSGESKTCNGIFNVGCQTSVDINKVAKIFDSKINYLPHRKGEPEASKANIAKIKKKLKWKPKISIKKGIKLLIKNSRD